MSKVLIAGYALAGAVGGFLLAVLISTILGEALAGPRPGGGDGWSSVGSILTTLVFVGPLLSALGTRLAVRLGRKLNPD